MILTLTLFACGKDSVTVNTHGDRISELERRADLIEQLAINNNMDIVQLCDSSDELALSKDDELYAVGFNAQGLGGLVKLNNGTFYTTTNLSNSCKFTVLDGESSTVSSGHNITNLFPYLNSSTPVAPVIGVSVSGGDLLKIGDTCISLNVSTFGGSGNVNGVSLSVVSCPL